MRKIVLWKILSADSSNKTSKSWDHEKILKNANNSENFKKASTNFEELWKARTSKIYRAIDKTH